MPRMQSRGALDPFETGSAWPTAGYLFELRILIRIGLLVERSGDKNRLFDLFAGQMTNDFFHDLDTHLTGKLNRVGVNLTLLDGDLAFHLAVKADNFDGLGSSRLIDCGVGSESAGIVDGENPDQIRSEPASWSAVAL